MFADFFTHIITSSYGKLIHPMIPGALLLETAGTSPAVLLCAILPLNYRVLNARIITNCYCVPYEAFFGFGALIGSTSRPS